MKISVIGPPGAGKSTQSCRLADSCRLDIISIGKLLREQKDVETEYGTPREYMQRGELVPKELVNHLVAQSVKKTDKYVIDGFPLTHSQAEFLIETTEVHTVLHLVVSDCEALRRTTRRLVCERCCRVYNKETIPPRQDGTCRNCGGETGRRRDDNHETARSRLQRYKRNIAPVLDYLGGEIDLYDIDGEASPTEVFRRIQSVI